VSGLSLQNAHVKIGGATLVQDVSFHIKPGQIVGLLGPNGAGKTTAIRALLGLQKMSNGSANIMGKDPVALLPNQRARAVSYLPQTRNMIWPISVRETVKLGLFAHGSNEAAIETVLEQCDLTRLANRAVNTLSGGENARVHLARALVSQTPALVVDEPTTALDPRHQFACLDLLAARARTGAAVLVILHDLHAASRYCDEIILLNNGALIAQGTPREVLTPQNLSRIYGVEGHWQASHLVITGPSGA
jgi:iron complex transport system ATP-binding protein